MKLASRTKKTLAVISIAGMGLLGAAPALAEGTPDTAEEQPAESSQVAADQTQPPAPAPEPAPSPEPVAQPDPAPEPAPEPEPVQEPTPDPAPAPEPETTEPPAEEPPATEPPATEPPAEEPPATEPPATEPPATEPPASEPEAVKPAPVAEKTEVVDVVDPAREAEDPKPSYLRWTVLDSDSAAVNEVSFTLQGPRSADATYTKLDATVTDNTGDPAYVGLDLDPAVGAYTVTKFVDDAHSTDAHELELGETYRVRASDVPKDFLSGDDASWSELSTIESEVGAQTPVVLEDVPVVEPEPETTEPKTEPRQQSRVAPQVMALAGAGAGYYKSTGDSTDPSGWYQSGNPCSACKVENFSSSYTQVNGKWVLQATWTRPNVDGAKGWSIEYTNAAERWGGENTGDNVPVPQPDRSLGGMVIILDNTDYSAQICLYTSQANYPGTCSPVSPSPLSSSNGGTTMHLNLQLPDSVVGTPGCPSTLGSTGYLRSWTGSNNPNARNVQAWAAPVSVDPPNSCEPASLTVIKKTLDEFGEPLSDNAAGWEFTATGDTVADGEAAQTTTTSGTKFALDINDPDTHTVNVAETVQDEFFFVSAVCTGSVNSPTVDDETATATVTVHEASAVTCTFTNQEKPRVATIVVEKNWVVTDSLGNTIFTTVPAEGTLPDGISAQLQVTLPDTAQQDVAWGEVVDGVVNGDEVNLNEVTSIEGLPGCELTSSALTYANGAVNTALPGTGEGLNVTLQAGANAYTFTNEVKCTTTLVLLKTVEGGGTGVPQDWNLTATGATVTQEVPGADTKNAENTIEVRAGEGMTLSEAFAASGENLAYVFDKLEVCAESNDTGCVTWTTVADPTAAVTVDLGQEQMYRFVNKLAPAIAVPLTGGISTDLFSGIGMTAAALAALLGTGLWLRTRRNQAAG